MANFLGQLATPFVWLGNKAASAGRQVVDRVVNGLQLIPNWLRFDWIPPTFQRLSREGVKSSAVVYSCINKYATAFPEPPIMSYEPGTDNPIVKHPVLDMLRRPCPVSTDEKTGRVLQKMSQTAWLGMVIIYMAIGGDCYLYKLRAADRRVVGLRPFHAGQMQPIMGKFGITSYLHTKGDSIYETVPAEDVIQISWPVLDPDEPWKGYPPLLAVAREVDTAAEAARYTYALFKNDATPRTIVSIPADSADKSKAKDVKARMEERFGNDNRGSIAVVTGGVDIKRLGLSLAELDSEAALQVPEAHIASGFGIPAIILGLNVGLKRSTFANYREARAAFTEDTLCPLWRLVADALTIGLENEYTSAPPFELRFDISRVVALRENQDTLNKQVLAEWQAGAITRNEFRARRKYEPLDKEQGAVYWYDVMKGATPAPPSEEPTADPSPKPTSQTEEQDDNAKD